MPSLVLIDGGIGQLHAAAAALEALGETNQPLAAIAKREEWIYVLGQESEPVVLDRYSRCCTSFKPSATKPPLREHVPPTSARQASHGGKPPPSDSSADHVVAHAPTHAASTIVSTHLSPHVYGSAS